MVRFLLHANDHLNFTARVVAALFFHVNQFLSLAGHIQQHFLERAGAADYLDNRPVKIGIRVLNALS